MATCGIKSAWRKRGEAMAKQNQRNHAGTHIAKGPTGKKALPAQTEKASIALAARGKEEKRKPKSKRPSRESIVGRDDADVEQVVGVPDESQIGEAIGRLEPADRKA